MKLFSDRRAIAALFTLLWLAGCAGGSTKMNAPAGSCVSLAYPKDPGSRTRLLLTPEVGIQGMGEEELKANIINFVRLPTTTCNDSKLALLKNALFEKKKGWDESIKEAVFNCQPIIGMTKEQALLSWGQPLKRTKISTSLGIQEKWLYRKLSHDRSCCFIGIAKIPDILCGLGQIVNSCSCGLLTRFIGISGKKGVGNTFVGVLFKRQLTFRDGILVTIREDD